MKTLLPISLMDLVAWFVAGHALPIEDQIASGLFNRWKLDFKLGLPPKSLEIVLPSDVSPVEDFEKLDGHAHCSEPEDHYFYCQESWNMMDHYTLEAGQRANLTRQESAAIWGWVYTDYFFINALAWGADDVETDVSGTLSLVSRWGCAHCPRRRCGPTSRFSTVI